MTRMSSDRLRRFIRHIDKPSGINACWTWTGSLSNTGHGVFLGTSAHRVAYEWLVGELDKSLVVDHRCEVPSCVNPHHLEAVSARENQTRARAPRDQRAVALELCRRGHAMTQSNTARVGKYTTCVRCRRDSELTRTRRTA